MLFHNISNEFYENLVYLDVRTHMNACTHINAYLVWSNVQTAWKMNHLKSKAKLNHHHFAHCDSRFNENRSVSVAVWKPMYRKTGRSKAVWNILAYRFHWHITVHNCVCVCCSKHAVAYIWSIFNVIERNKARYSLHEICSFHSCESLSFNWNNEAFG